MGGTVVQRIWRMERAAARRAVDLPSEVMDLVVAVPAGQHHVVQAGRPAFRDRPHMMGVADVGIGTAGEATPVAGSQQLALGLCGAAHGVGTPYRSSLAVVDHAGESGVAGQFFEHRPRQPLPIGKLGDELTGGLIDVCDHTDVSEGLATGPARGSAGELIEGVGHALVEGAPRP